MGYLGCGAADAEDYISTTSALQPLTSSGPERLERGELTQARDHTVAESLRVAHDAFRRHAEIPQHLHCLDILQHNLFLFALALAKGLMHEPAE